MDSYLAHHGVKGQKWGVRRQALKGASQTVQGAKKVSDIANEQPRNRYDKRKPLTQEEIDNMSNKELQELVTRMNLEQQYSALTADKVNQSRIDKGLRYTDAILSIAGGVLTIALAYNQLKG